MTYSSTVQHQGGPSGAFLLEGDIGSVTFLLQAGDGSAEEEKVLDLVFRGLGGQSSDLMGEDLEGNGQQRYAIAFKRECENSREQSKTC